MRHAISVPTAVPGPRLPTSTPSPPAASSSTTRTCQHPNVRPAAPACSPAATPGSLRRPPTTGPRSRRNSWRSPRCSRLTESVAARAGSSGDRALRRPPTGPHARGACGTPTSRSSSSQHRRTSPSSTGLAARIPIANMSLMPDAPPVKNPPTSTACRPTGPTTTSSAATCSTTRPRSRHMIARWAN